MQEYEEDYLYKDSYLNLTPGTKLILIGEGPDYADWGFSPHDFNTGDIVQISQVLEDDENWPYRFIVLHSTGTITMYADSVWSMPAENTFYKKQPWELLDFYNG